MFMLLGIVGSILTQFTQDRWNASGAPPVLFQCVVVAAKHIAQPSSRGGSDKRLRITKQFLDLVRVRHQTVALDQIHDCAVDENGTDEQQAYRNEKGDAGCEAAQHRHWEETASSSSGLGVQLFSGVRVSSSVAGFWTEAAPLYLPAQ